MSRHRGVRNRQFSYDEGEDDYYDEDEEADAACEEYRQSVLQARGDGSGSGSGVSLSSYFDVADTSSKLNKQQQQRVGTGGGGGGYGASLYAGDNTDGGAGSAGVDPEDAELVEAIAGELEKRLGKGRFSPRRVRQAVVDGEYDVDTAEVILLTLDQAPSASGVSGADVANQNNGVSNNEPALPPGLGYGGADVTVGGTSSPSSLAFGLKVDGRGDWKRVGGGDDRGTCSGGDGGGAGNGSTAADGQTATVPALPPGFGGATVPAATDGGDGGLAPFGFDTPSPDDINLYRQSNAGRMPTSGIGGGIATPTQFSGGVGGGERGTGIKGNGAKKATVTAISSPNAEVGASGSGRKKATVTDVSSPKAKVVHIGTGSTPTTAPRKSVLSPTRGGSTPTPTRGSVVSAQELSPTRPKLNASTTPQTAAPAAAAEGADESDDGEPVGKERLAMVVIGHVDAGKSTLMGQVLVQLGQVSQRILHKQEKEAREAGKASFFLAWVMDEDQEERAHGVTIEVAQKYIETDTKLVTLLDAPGHRDFIPKMIGGATAADAAVLVVPAAAGEFESAFQASGQTQEHAMLVKALGVNQLLVVVNKLDATDPPWSQERYEAIKAEVGPFLTSQRVGFKPKKVRFVPASGLSAENISRRDPNGALSKWYDGPTLLEAIDAFSPTPRATDKAFRMCIADVVPTGKGVTVSGRVVQGRVRTGDKVVVMPLEDLATVVRLERNGAVARSSRAGDNVEVSLSGVDASRVVVGNVVCKAVGGSRVATVRRFNAQIVALPALEVPIIKGTEFQLHMHNLDVVVHCSKLTSLTNSAGEVLKSKPRCVPPASTAHIRISCSRPICLEKYSACRPLGRFVLRQKSTTVAVGLVVDTETR